MDPQNFEPNLALDLEISDLINSKKGTASAWTFPYALYITDVDVGHVKLPLQSSIISTIEMPMCLYWHSR